MNDSNGTLKKYEMPFRTRTIKPALGAKFVKVVDDNGVTRRFQPTKRYVRATREGGLQQADNLSGSNGWRDVAPLGKGK